MKSCTKDKQLKTKNKGLEIECPEFMATLDFIWIWIVPYTYLLNELRDLDETFKVYMT